MLFDLRKVMLASYEILYIPENKTLRITHAHTVYTYVQICNCYKVTTQLAKNHKQ